jgi:hypothetical protein
VNELPKLFMHTNNEIKDKIIYRECLQGDTSKTEFIFIKQTVRTEPKATTENAY